MGFDPPLGGGPLDHVGGYFYLQINTLFFILMRKKIVFLYMKKKYDSQMFKKKKNDAKLCVFHDTWNREYIICFVTYAKK